MGAHKLDIEFEDDDDLKAKEEAARKEAETRKKQEEALDLEFDVAEDEAGQAQASPQSSAPAPKKTAPAQKQTAPPQGSPAPAQEPVQATAQPTQVNTGAYMHASPGAANYNLGDELRNVIGGNRILEIELQAKVEIAVTHRLTTIIAENAQENKVLETKVNKILAQVAAKAPALKKELTMIKRLLAEHSAVDKSKVAEEKEGAAPVSKKPVAKPAVKKKAS